MKIFWMKKNILDAKRKMDGTLEEENKELVEGCWNWKVRKIVIGWIFLFPFLNLSCLFFLFGLPFFFSSFRWWIKISFSLFPFLLSSSSLRRKLILKFFLFQIHERKRVLKNSCEKRTNYRDWKFLLKE